jgi:hypothetical protein
MAVVGASGGVSTLAASLTPQVRPSHVVDWWGWLARGVSAPVCAPVFGALGVTCARWLPCLAAVRPSCCT